MMSREPVVLSPATGCPAVAGSITSAAAPAAPAGACNVRGEGALLRGELPFVYIDGLVNDNDSVLIADEPTHRLLVLPCGIYVIDTENHMFIAFPDLRELALYYYRREIENTQERLRSLLERGESGEAEEERKWLEKLLSVKKLLIYAFSDVLAEVDVDE